MEKEMVISNYDRQVDIGRRIFMEYNQDKIIRKFHLLSDHQWIFLDYLIPLTESAEQMER